MVDRFEEFVLKDIIINSSEKKPFTAFPPGISSMAVSFPLKIDEKLLPPLVRIVLNRMTHVPPSQLEGTQDDPRSRGPAHLRCSRGRYWQSYWVKDNDLGSLDSEDINRMLNLIMYVLGRYTGCSNQNPMMTSSFRHYYTEEKYIRVISSFRIIYLKYPSEDFIEKTY